MKRKVMSMAMAAAMITVCLTGCGEKKTGNIEDALNSMSDEQLESAALAGASKTDTASSKADKVVFEPTEEILNADLSSGLIQIYDDVFRQGGYQTVEEFVKQNSDKYDFEYRYPNSNVTCKTSPYEECKDYLLKYSDSISEDFLHSNSLVLTKKNNPEIKIRAFVANLTNKDEKITLDKAQVVYFSPYLTIFSDKVPAWASMGFSICKNGSNNGNWSVPKDIKSLNEQYTVKSLIELLETKGYQKDIDISSQNDKVYNAVESFNIINVNVYVLGEPNLVGERPEYHYKFSFNENTDKLSTVRFDLNGSIKDAN